MGRDAEKRSPKEGDQPQEGERCDLRLSTRTRTEAMGKEGIGGLCYKLL